jgi:hypothetical protein
MPLLPRLVLHLCALFPRLHCCIPWLFYSSILPSPHQQINSLWSGVGAHPFATKVGSSEHEHRDWPSCASPAIPPLLFCSMFAGKDCARVCTQSLHPHCCWDRDPHCYGLHHTSVLWSSKRFDPVRYEWYLQLNSLRFNRPLPTADTCDIWCNPWATYRKWKRRPEDKISTLNPHLLQRSWISRYPSDNQWRNSHISMHWLCHCSRWV